MIAKKFRPKNFLTGFTLVETLVVVSIFVVISSMILANYPGFNDRFDLKRTISDIALSSRQAEAYGSGVKEFGTGSNIFPGYGIYFQKSSPKDYIIFADINGNKTYDGPAELVQQFHISTSGSIYDICGNQKTNPPGTCNLSGLTVIYLRSPIGLDITVRGGDGNNYTDAEVIVRSARGLQSKLILWVSGQIAVE